MIKNKTEKRKGEKKMKMLVTQIQEGDYNKSMNGKINVFLDIVEEPRPFNNGGANIMEDIAWRRTHKTPLTRKEAKRLKDDVFRAIGHIDLIGRKDIKINYSRYAGCKMCPCSPGYIITIPDAWSIGNDVWVTVMKGVN